MTAAPQKLSVSIPTLPPIPNPSPRPRLHARAPCRRQGKAGGPGSRPVPPAPACRGACRGKLRKLNLGRDQILARLWELTNLSSEATRVSIAGQVKAMAMIVAIEGLIPSGTMNDRRLSLTQNQPAAPPAQAQNYTSEWLRTQQSQAEGTEPADVVAATKVQADAGRPREPEPPPQPAPKPANNASSPKLDRHHSSVINPFINPAKGNWVPGATGNISMLHSTQPTHPGYSFPPNRHRGATKSPKMAKFYRIL
jgi:hypothetical protein